MSVDVVILGVYAADLVFQAERMPKLGETVLGRGFAISSGGKGSNQAVAAARAGAKTAFVTRVGADGFGDQARALWAEEGIAAEGVVVDPEAPTGAAFIFLDPQGANAVLMTPGAAARIGDEEIARAAPLIAGAQVVLTQLEQPLAAAERALAMARAAGATTILNPAPAAEIPDSLLALCDYVTPNESEAEALTGLAVTDASGARRAGEALIRRGARNALLTLGARGALLVGAAGEGLFPALPGVTPLDTTGAGDAFNGGVAAALAEGRPPAEAIRFASALAGLSVERFGAASGMPRRAEIEAALARF